MPLFLTVFANRRSNPTFRAQVSLCTCMPEKIARILNVPPVIMGNMATAVRMVIAKLKNNARL